MLPWLLRVWRRLPFPVRMLYLRVRYGHFAVGVAARIRDAQGRILIVRRTYSPEEPWALPGGWLEGNDAIDRTLERELLEETGLRVRVGHVRAVERVGFALVLLMDTELLDPVAAFRPSPEVSEIAWAEPSEIGRLAPLNARLLRHTLG